MEQSGVVSLLIILFTFYTSYKGITVPSYFEKYSFQIDRILIQKDYIRLITSGFIHVTWMHLIVNMVAFQSFGSLLEGLFGIPKFLVLYFGSLLGGNLFALFIHRGHGNYTACGASGAISGLIFSFISLFPSEPVGILFLPVHLPGWAFGILYVLFCMYGIKSKLGNIGHEAHLGGGVAGMIITVAMFPWALTANYLTILLIIVPTVIFLYLIIARPAFLLVDNPFRKPTGSYTFEDKYHGVKRSKEKELDKLLDKISRQGLESLSKREKEQLEKLSNLK